MSSLSIQAIQTEIFRAGAELSSFISSSVPANLIRDGMILTITSKIVSLSENRTLPFLQVTDKRALIRDEADIYLGEIGYGCDLTIKNGLLIATAGIDQSNSQSNAYILYPKDPFASAEKIWRDLRVKWGLKNLGVILTDSRTQILRRGVTGVALSFAGFRAVRSLVGAPDLFGREMKTTKVNIADALASAAVLTMGEANERKPLAVIHGPTVEFCENVRKEELIVPPEEDMYFSVIQAFRDKKS